MQTLDEGAKQAKRLYRLTFLLTGNVATSTRIAMEAIDSLPDTDDCSPNPMEESRSQVIAKALASVRTQLRASSRRLRLLSEAVTLRVDATGLTCNATRAQVERALLAIDVFPRCVLVLRTLEGISIEGTATLLEVNKDLVREAQVIGLYSLVDSIHRAQDYPWHSAAMTSDDSSKAGNTGLVPAHGAGGLAVRPSPFARVT